MKYDLKGHPRWYKKNMYLNLENNIFDIKTSYSNKEYPRIEITN